MWVWGSILVQHHCHYQSYHDYHLTSDIQDKNWYLVLKSLKELTGNALCTMLMATIIVLKQTLCLWTLWLILTAAFQWYGTSNGNGLNPCLEPTSNYTCDSWNIVIVFFFKSLCKFYILFRVQNLNLFLHISFISFSGFIKWNVVGAYLYIAQQWTAAFLAAFLLW